MQSAMLTHPSEVVIYTTSKCNGRCKFCLRQSEGYKRRPDVTPELVRQVLDAYPRIGSACVAGFGEPLMMDRLGELLEMLAQRNVYTGLITNGLLVVEKEEQVPWKLIGHVTVSVNAADALEHEEAMGIPGAFADLEDGVDLLTALGVPTILSYVIGKNNWQRIPDYLRTTRALGAVDAVFVNTLPHGDLSDPDYCKRFLAEGVITTADEEIVRGLQEHRRVAEDLGVRVGHWPVPIDIDENPRLCRSPFSRIGVDGNGDITGCIRIIPPTEGFGNIVKDGPMIWSTSEHLRDLRDGIAGRAEMCDECEYCFGNWIEG